MTAHNGFTKRALEQLEPRKSRYRVKDEHSRDSVSGLLLEVMPSGSKHFRFRRRLNGKDLQVTIGRFPTTSIENARKRAVAIAAEMVQGIDPNEQKREAVAAYEREKALSMTVQQLFDAYVAEFRLKIRSGERRQKSLDDIEGNWRTHLKERVGHLQVKDIDRTQAENLIKLIFTANTPSVRNKCLTVMKAMFAEQ